MTQNVYTNFASGVLALDCNIGDPECSVELGQGALFPVLPDGDNIAVVVLEDNLGNQEICHLTQVVSDTLSITRAREGTAERGFPAGSRIELRVTAGVLSKIDCGEF